MTDDSSNGRKPLSLMRELFGEAVAAAQHENPQARPSMLAFAGSAAAQVSARKELNSAVAALRAPRKTIVCEFKQPQPPTAGSFIRALSAELTAHVPSTSDVAMTLELVRRRIGGRTLFIIVNGCQGLLGNVREYDGITTFLQGITSIPKATIVMFGDESLLRIREHPQLDRRLRIMRLDEVAESSSV